MSGMDHVFQRLDDNREKLVISRIPIRIKREFIKFADEEFCSDYGMCLKFLWDFFTGAFIAPVSENEIANVVARIEAVEKKLEKLNEPKEKPIRLLDGREIRRK